MNSITKRNQLNDMMERYALFLRHCDTQADETKIIGEMMSIVVELRKIKMMGRDELHRQIVSRYEELPSKLNCMEEHFLTPRDYYGKRTA